MNKPETTKLLAPRRTTEWPDYYNILPPETVLHMEVPTNPAFYVMKVKDVTELRRRESWQREKIASLRTQMSQMNAGYRKKIARLERRIAQLEGAAYVI